MARSASRKGSRSVLDTFAVLLRVILGIIFACFALLILSETPSIRNWLAGVEPESPLIGLVAGHWQNDSGAVCENGLREVDLNLEIARSVAHILREQGYQAEVLPEFSPKLNGYKAAVFLAIHCDSCIEELSGFKIARMTHSSAPDREDELVELLYESYAQATGLQPHLNTITDDMRQYHALRQIAPETPGAIIECGFMGGDQYLLTEETDRVAVGIANGILAFLRNQSAPTETPALPVEDAQQ